MDFIVHWLGRRVMNISKYPYLIVVFLIALLVPATSSQTSEKDKIFLQDRMQEQAVPADYLSFIPSLDSTNIRSEQSFVIAATSCKVCGQRSRSCHAPCKRMSKGPGKGSCHSKCKSRYSVCKRGCSKGGGGKKIQITIDLSGKNKKKKVSAKQAKKIVIATRNQAVAATPPNIDDITAILREQKPDPKLIAQLSKDAERKPPRTKSKSKLATFYKDRGHAAGKIGRTKQEIGDLEKAVRYAKAAKNRKLMYRTHGDLSNAQFGSGLYKPAIENREKALKYAQWPSQKLRHSAILAVAYSSLGNVGAAERKMANVRKILRKEMDEKTWKKWGLDLSRNAKYGQATIYLAKGENKKAANLITSALYDYERFVKQNRNATSKKYIGVVRQVLRRRHSIALERDGKLVEAELVIRKALLDRLKETGLYSTWAPRIVLRFADHLALQGRYDESRQLTKVAIDVMRKLGFAEGSHRLFSAQMTLARLEFLSGRPEKAIAIYEIVEKELGKASDIIKRILQKDIDRLLTLATTGRHADVVALLGTSKDPGGKSKKANTKPKIRGAARRGAYAIALAKSGEAEGAYREFRKVIPKLVSLSEAQADEEYTTGTAREYRKSIIFEAYLGLLADIRGTPLEAKLGIDAAAISFQIADEARGQLVQKAVSAASARASVDNKELAALVRTEQDTRKRLTAQSGLLASILATPSDQQDPKAVKELSGNIAKLKEAVTALHGDLKKKFPDYAALLNPKAPGIADIQKALRPDEAFVSIYLGRERSYVWALPKSGELAFHASKLTQERATKFVEALRGALNPQVATLGDIPDFDVRVAYKLYQQILQPVEAGWKPAKSLLVSTNGALGQLPLTVLPTEVSKLEDGEGPLFKNYRGVNWLARSHAMTLLPSAATLVTLRSIPKGDESRKPFIGFGDPLFNKAHANKKEQAPTKVADALASRGVLRTRGLPIRLRAAPKVEGVDKPNLSLLPALPDTGDEVRSIAIAMQADPSTAVQLGLKANEDTIRNQDLSGYKVIAFATHGLIPGDLSGLREPALALSAPGLAKSKGDGLLTMSEIMGLKLDADWVVLSACNTGSGRGAGAEAVSGLGRAFFYAGTRALLVSSWPVETVSARLLTTDVFARMTQDKGLSRAAALQQAVSALIDKPAQTDPDTKEPLFYYAHPIFWAPFILVGDGGKIASAI
jgi:CHAT domain-containing protein